MGRLSSLRVLDEKTDSLATLLFLEHFKCLDIAKAEEVCREKKKDMKLALELMSDEEENGIAEDQKKVTKAAFKAAKKTLKMERQVLEKIRKDVEGVEGKCRRALLRFCRRVLRIPKKRDRRTKCGLPDVSSVKTAFLIQRWASRDQLVELKRSMRVCSSVRRSMDVARAAEQLGVGWVLDAV